MVADARSKGELVATKWEVNRAVRCSDLPAPSRLILLTLSDVAMHGTAEIPEQFTPSLRILAQETGLGEATVKRHLSDMEAAGWIVRNRPTQEAARLTGARTTYRLDVPQGPEVSQARAQSEPPMAQPGPTQGPERAQPGPTAGPIKEDSRSLTIRNDQTPSRDSRPDVDEICRYLADKIEANGSKRPRITPKWRTEARLLLDADGKAVDQVKRAIDWCQADGFWRSNVLSMTKLRDKWDQMRLAALRPNGRGSPALVEVNGLKLKPETAERIAGRARLEAMDAQRAAIEGPR
jgi:DNA-binding Lrp family transcriptional regulator